MKKLSRTVGIFSVMLLALALASGALLTVSAATAQQNYIGPQACSGCHPENYEKWEGSKHAQAFSDPVFQEVWTGRGSPPECLACHTTGFDPETGEYAFEGVTCESCHGAGMAMQKTLDASLCGQCHTGAHHPTYDEWNESKHSESIETLKAIGQDKNEYCLSCHSAEGALAKITGEEWSPELATTPIVCAVCHNPHEAELRVEPSVSLCGQCHKTQYELWEANSPHGLADVECASCHMYTKPYVSEEEPAATGHTFEIVEVDGKPATCQKCHSVIEAIPNYDTVVTVLESIQSSTSSMMDEVEAAIKDAEQLINEAKTVSGIDTSVIEQATALLNETKHAFEFKVVRDYSKGFHNPAEIQKLISLALGNVSEVKSMVLTAKADALLNQMSASEELVKTLQEQNKELQNQLSAAKEQLAASQDKINQLQSQVDSLNEQVNTLKGKIAELQQKAAAAPAANVYMYLIIGLVVGLIIGGVAAYAARRKP